MINIENNTLPWILLVKFTVLEVRNGLMSVQSAYKGSRHSFGKL